MESTPDLTPSAPPPAASGAPATPALATAAAPVVAPATIQFDDFAKIELRVGLVLECSAHPNADKLLVLKVDLGTEQRQICAGLKTHYAPEQLVGQRIVVVANLAPRTMRGQISQGMMLAATDAATGKVIFISPSQEAAPGSKVS